MAFSDPGMPPTVMPEGAVLDGNVAAETWTVIVPVKPLGEAKSRLRAEQPGADAWARAFLSDVLAAVSAVERISTTIVATSDAEVSSIAQGWGALVIDDSDAPGINGAVSHAAQYAPADSGIAVVVSDLPLLTPQALARVLAYADQHRTSFLADLEGTGTTMWMTHDRGDLPPHFGSGSRAAHTAAGAHDIVLEHDDPALLPARSDIDTLTDLQRAGDNLLGPATRQLVRGSLDA